MGSRVSLSMSPRIIPKGHGTGTNPRSKPGDRALHGYRAHALYVYNSRVPCPFGEKVGDIIRGHTKITLCHLALERVHLTVDMALDYVPIIGKFHRHRATGTKTRNKKCHMKSS